jgi:hypothetical protein
MAKYCYRISPDGRVITGLWNDMLSNVRGEKTVERASEVEYDAEAQGWTISFLGRFSHLICSKVFEKREDALAEERAILNREITLGG